MLKVFPFQLLLFVASFHTDSVIFHRSKRVNSEFKLRQVK